MAVQKLVHASLMLSEIWMFQKKSENITLKFVMLVIWIMLPHDIHQWIEKKSGVYLIYHLTISCTVLEISPHH